MSVGTAAASGDGLTCTQFGLGSECCGWVTDQRRTPWRVRAKTKVLLEIRDA